MTSSRRIYYISAFGKWKIKSKTLIVLYSSINCISGDTSYPSNKAVHVFDRHYVRHQHKIIKVKRSLYRPRQGPGGSRRFSDTLHTKATRLSALRTGRLHPQERSLVHISVRGSVNPRATLRPEGLIKNVKDSIGNRTRDIPACSAVSQDT